MAGRDFSENILSRIRRRVVDEPTLTRSALSREVCGRLQWQGGDGRPKDVSCRVALLRLARRGACIRNDVQPLSSLLELFTTRSAVERSNR